jgi:hypothetical protein
MRRGCALLFLSVGLAAALRADEELPFEYLHNQIVLRATINGTGPYNVLLDTGTHASTIDLRLARKLRISLARLRGESKGAGSGRVIGQQAILEELRLGGLAVTGLAAAALDLSKLSAELGRPLHGVLGHNFLVSRITQVDYFRRRIRFLAEPVASLPDDPRRITFPMQFRAGSILPVLDECYVNGIRLTVTLDTGSSLGLVLFPKAVDFLGLKKLARAGIPMDATGYRGRARLRKGWVRSVVLKTIDLSAIEVAYVESGYGEDELLEHRGGNLGNAVLQDFVLTLDYPNRIVVLQSAIE